MIAFQQMSDNMFTWINSLCVKSDKGFEVESVDRFACEYREGDEKITVHIDYGRGEDGKLEVVISPSAFVRWDGKPRAFILPIEKQKEIKSNFIAAIEFQGMRVLVI